MLRTLSFWFSVNNSLVAGGEFRVVPLLSLQRRLLFFSPLNCFFWISLKTLQGFSTWWGAKYKSLSIFIISDFSLTIWFPQLKLKAAVEKNPRILTSERVLHLMNIKRGNYFTILHLYLLFFHFPFSLFNFLKMSGLESPS